MLTLRYLPHYLAIFAVIYFPMMASMPLTIDAEGAAFNRENGIWIAQGRWTTYLISEFIVPTPVVPYFPIALFGASLAVAYALLMGARDREPILRYGGFAVLAATPIWSFILEFPANVPSIAFAVLASAGAAKLSVSQNWRNLLLASILLGLATGAYQAFLPVFFAMALTVHVLREETRLSMLFKIALIGIAGCVVYAVGQSAALQLTGISVSYIGKFLQWSLIADDPIGVVGQTLRSMIWAFGTPDGYGVWLWSMQLLMISAVITILARRRWAMLIWLALACIAPFALAFAAGGDVPFRTYLGIPVAALLAFLITASDPNRRVQIASASLAVIYVLQSTALISQYQGQRIFTDEFNRSTANQLYERIAAVGPVAGPLTVDFFGSLSAPSIYTTGRGSTAAGSFFSWDGGNPERIVPYMRLLGYPVIAAERVRRRELISVYETMSTWPNEGSVALVDDIVLVKLSDQPGFYYD